MSDISIFKNRIVKKGAFDVNKIYKECKAWFSNNEYNYTESEKTTKPKAQGIEIIYKGFGERDVTDYFRFKIEVAFLFEHLKEVQRNNKKMYEGKAEMRVSVILVIDYKNIWERTKLSKFLHEIYKKHLIKKQIESVYGGKCYGEGMTFFQKMKEAFELNTF
jgi:hypothetical protein